MDYRREANYAKDSVDTIVDFFKKENKETQGVITKNREL